MRCSRAGKVRRQTPFIPSKHITLPDIKQKLAPIPLTDVDYHTILNKTIYDNQLDRNKKKNGRSKMRSQFNKYITNNNVDVDEETHIDNYEFAEASFYSLIYPKTEIEGEFSVFSVPLVESTVNSIQRQLFTSQLPKLRRMRTDANRKKRKLDRRGKKLFERRLRTLKSAPPLFTAPSPKNSILASNRMVSVTSVGSYSTGRKMH